MAMYDLPHALLATHYLPEGT